VAPGNETIAQTLGKYVVHLQYSALPKAVIEEAKAALLDQLGCQLIGSTLDWNRVVHDFVAGFEGRAESTIINYGTRALAHDAGYVNGTFGQGAELDQSFDRAGGHPGAMTVPTALAVGEKLHVDGASFLTAIIAGYDVAYRLSVGTMPALARRGFHPQSVLGVFVASAVAGKLLGLNADQMTHALAIAGSHASGTMEYDQSGGEVKRLHTGLAVRGGIQAAMLAKLGLTGPPTIFEGKRGLLPLFAVEYQAEQITKGLGQDFGVMHGVYKVYSTVGTIQTAIDVLVNLIAEHGLKAEDVARIDVGLTESTLLHGASIYEPQDTIGAQFSLAFSLAIRLLKGSNDLPLYMDASLWKDSQVLSLARKVHTYALAEAQGDKVFASKVKVTLGTGKAVEGSQDYRRGSPRNPLTTDQRLQKFRSLASAVLSAAQSDKVIRAVDEVEQLSDIGQLAALLVPGK